MNDNPKKTHNLVIIGSGPAAHTAAIYASRAELSPILFEGFMAGGVAAGGQLTTTTEVENFPGFPEGISGPNLMSLLRKQSQRFGTQIFTETITKVNLETTPFHLWREGFENDEATKALAIIIATGATAKKLPISGSDDYWQKGISACAVCDGALPIFRNKELAVIGGGDSAVEEATFLTKYASKVHLIHRRETLRASQIMQKRVFTNPKIQIHWNSEATSVSGNGSILQKLQIQKTKTQEKQELSISGLFFAIGHTPNTKPFQGQIDLDKDGYVQVKAGTTCTNIEGVFAAGDVQDKKYRQAITAAGSGCMAALDSEHWLRSL